MNIQPVNTASSKQEEMYTLEKMARLAEPGSYLSSLFNRGMIEWTLAKVRDDFSPDLWEAYVQAESEAERQCSRAITAEITIKRMTQEHLDRMQASHNENARLAAELDDHRKQEEHLREMCHQTREELRDTNSALVDACTALKNAQEEITRLKAQIYDLEHATK